MVRRIAQSGRLWLSGLFAAAEVAVLASIGCGGHARSDFSAPPVHVNDGGLGGVGNAAGAARSGGTALGGTSGSDDTGGVLTAGEAAVAGRETGGASGAGGGASRGGTGSGGRGGAGDGGLSAGGVGLSSPGGAGGAGASARGGAAGMVAAAGARAMCNSVDGSGCDEPATYCVDLPDDCSPDAGTAASCAGACVEPFDNECDPYLFGLNSCSTGLWCHPDALAFQEDDQHFICLVVAEETAQCDTDADCVSGFACISVGDIGACAPRIMACSGAVTCTTAPPECPSRHKSAIIDGCFGPCVPLDHCGCQKDADCASDGSCDRVIGLCRSAK